MGMAEWRHIPKGSTFKGKIVPTETWFAVLKNVDLIIGTVVRAGDDRWVLGYLTHEQTRVVLYQPAHLTLIEIQQRWEHEFTEYVRKNPRTRH